MRDFLRAELYYLRKDTAFKSISATFLLGCIVLIIIIGTKGGYELDSAVQPLSIAAEFSLFLYLIIPLHACFFATEGFEYGSIQNIIAAGRSRRSYFMGKYILEILAVCWWLLQFFGLFYILYLAAALVTGARIGNESYGDDFSMAVRAIGFNILYLSAYAAAVMMLGMLMRKASSAVVVTFFFIFGNLLLSGYLKDSSSPLLRAVSDYSLMTQIMKFSGMYSDGSQRIPLSGTGDYVRAVAVPVLVIAVCLAITLIFVEKKDIQL
ncbi:ABC transporter permease [Paenibacillus ihuae]|uniref:ABC transporter permease n=1 Tax=Paenibacillus ihuae TaxID=1232431 RepID=UPI0006D5A123|nr:ABC transporter permease [Paenibacillus ihuae]